MKNLLKLEELFMFALSIFFFTKLDFVWWWYLVFLFTPDLSMLGYLFNSQIGAATYNFVHHKALGISIFVLGIILVSQPIQFAGLILFGHSSMDRVMGYGLKHTDSFQHTHLGMIGKA
ncbi:MAG: DUF4260 domain-containing protein [Anaerolineales bacterium]|nr:DUF4260 domain-containing protein [Anaerolineales bacterium]